MQRNFWFNGCWNSNRLTLMPFTQIGRAYSSLLDQTSFLTTPQWWQGARITMSHLFSRVIVNYFSFYVIYVNNTRLRRKDQGKNIYQHVFERLIKRNVTRQLTDMIRVSKQGLRFVRMEKDVRHFVNSNISHPVMQDRQKYAPRYFGVVFF